MKDGLIFLSSSLYWTFTLYGILPLTVVYGLLLLRSHPGKVAENAVSCAFFLIFSALVGNSIAYFLNAIGVMFEEWGYGFAFLFVWIIGFSAGHIVLGVLPGKVFHYGFPWWCRCVLGVVTAAILTGLWYSVF